LNLDLFKLLVFVTVVDRNGYSAAASQLSLSQATVSFHLRSLERQLGKPLVVYERRNVRLTPSGEIVYAAARRMLGEEERLLRSLQTGSEGRIRLGASMAFEQPYFMEEVIAPFRRDNPGILLSIRFGSSVKLAEAVRDGLLDLGYVIGWHVPRGVRFEPLQELSFILLAAREHPLAQRDGITVEEVAQAGIITAPLEDVEWAHYQMVLRSIGLDDAQMVLEMSGVQARMLAARCGLGIMGTFFPPHVSPEQSGELVPLNIDRPAPTVQAGLVSRGSPPEPVRSLAGWLRRRDGP
jgi:DNA-binding transcriptional LysR family regulator